MKKENNSEIESLEMESKSDIASESTNIEDDSIALKPSAHAGRPSYKKQKKKIPAEDKDYLSSSKFSLLSDKTSYAHQQAKKMKVTFSKNEKKKKSPLCEEEEWEKYMKKNGLKPSLGGAPSPSSRVPSFIAMVKTAIRDLKPYKMTHKEGIAKYIEIRYRVKNCKLLKYVLKWMVEMDILKKKGCNFNFVKKRMFMDSQSVASCDETTVSKPKRKCPPKRKTCPPKRKTCRPKPKCPPKRKTCRPKPKCPPKRKKCRPEPKCPPKPKAKSKKTKPNKCKSSKRHEGCERVRCNCYEKLNSKKNRIKLKSRYVKKCGKIYLESVYI